MKALEIILFKPMPVDLPAMLCNVCGSIAHGPDRHHADIKPFTDEEETCSFVVCSEACKQSFLNYPTLDNYIMKCINEAIGLHAREKKLLLKLEFRLWFLEIDKLTISN